MKGAESIAAARHIAALPTSAQRREALARIPPAFRLLVQETATHLRFVCLNWRKRIDAGLPLDQVPDRVRIAMDEILGPGTVRK